MAKRTGLGRGLDALFADAAPIYEEDAATEPQAEELGKAADADKIAKAGNTGTGAKKSTSKAAGSSDTTKTKSGKSAKAAVASSVAAADTANDDEDRVLYIDINDIKPNKAQPRSVFDEDKLRELEASIKEHGVIQPLIIRPAENGYELVAGERRWRASRLAGLKKVPCIIRNFDDRQNAIVAIIENMQREDLNPIEEAEGLKSMTEKYGFTQEQVSNSLGKSRTYITNSIRLLKLPKEIQQYVSSGQMSAAHGRTLINVSDADKQRAICDKIIKNGLSVRETEKLAEKAKDEIKPDRKKRKQTAKKKSSDILAVEEELRKLSGTKVTINGDSKKGKLELEYYSTEELNRLIDTLREAFV